MASSRGQGGISGKANAAIDKAIDPAKELDMAILELEEGRQERRSPSWSRTGRPPSSSTATSRSTARRPPSGSAGDARVKVGDDEAAKLALARRRPPRQRR